MKKLIISKDQVQYVLPVLNRSSADLKVIVINVRKRKYPFVKGDSIRLYHWNLKNVLRFLCEINCKSVSNLDNGQQKLVLRTTYERRYYLNKIVKEAGFQLKIELNSKTIIVPEILVDVASENLAIKELANAHNYGIQYSML